MVKSSGMEFFFDKNFFVEREEHGEETTGSIPIEAFSATKDSSKSNSRPLSSSQ